MFTKIEVEAGNPFAKETEDKLSEAKMEYDNAFNKLYREHA
jgi:hypothetical protein